jgi:phage terminase small subunit
LSYRTIAPEFLLRLQERYVSPALASGNPLDACTLLGLLHLCAAFSVYNSAIADLKTAGAQIPIAG